MRNICFALLPCMLFGAFSAECLRGQEKPKHACRCNRVVRVATWPIRTGYTQTRDTFRDTRKSKLLLAEALILLATSAFDTATTVSAMHSANLVETDPIMRPLIGRKPHGARPWLVTAGLATLELDTAHYLGRENHGLYHFASHAGILGVSLGHVWAGTSNLQMQTAYPAPAKPSNVSHGVIDPLSPLL